MTLFRRAVGWWRNLLIKSVSHPFHFPSLIRVVGVKLQKRYFVLKGLSLLYYKTPKVSSLIPQFLPYLLSSDVLYLFCWRKGQHVETDWSDFGWYSGSSRVKSCRKPGCHWKGSLPHSPSPPPPPTLLLFFFILRRTYFAGISLCFRSQTDPQNIQSHIFIDRGNSRGKKGLSSEFILCLMPSLGVKRLSRFRR